MSKTAYEFYHKRLKNLFAVAEAESFLKMIWAVRAAQTGNSRRAAIFLEFPKEFVTSDITSDYYIHPWRLEDVLNEYFVTAQGLGKAAKKGKVLNCQSYATVTSIFYYLGKMQNAESGLHLENVHVLDELVRISHKQFEWQRGFLNIASLYRSAYLYAGPECIRYFENTYGVSFVDFSLIGFGLYSHFLENPIIGPKIDSSLIDVPIEATEKILSLISAPIDRIRHEASDLRQIHSYGSYSPSVLRRIPCIDLSKKGKPIVFAPIPELVLQRVSVGMYYDIISGGNQVRNEIGRQFERYCLNLLKAGLSGFQYLEAVNYKRKKNNVYSPDILVCEQDSIRLVVECKSKRMNISSKFDPTKFRTPDGWDEIVKAVVQIWRFFCDCRRGICSSHSVDKKAIGLVLTLDPWLTMTHDRYARIMAEANTILAKKEPLMQDVDRRRIAFCDINDLESLICKADKESFVDTISCAASTEKAGWLLTSIHKELRPENTVNRKYPFSENIADVLPWWNKI
ncbi:MAG: hypothetical protein GXP06_09270 [Alphaproteobacteria bacterium]|nr:hypothetical protein [Alphaproteobacteria bacterium]